MLIKKKLMKIHTSKQKLMKIIIKSYLKIHIMVKLKQAIWFSRKVKIKDCFPIHTKKIFLRKKIKMKILTITNLQ